MRSVYKNKYICVKVILQVSISVIYQYTIFAVYIRARDVSIIAINRTFEEKKAICPSFR